MTFGKKDEFLREKIKIWRKHSSFDVQEQENLKIIVSSTFFAFRQYTEELKLAQDALLALGWDGEGNSRLDEIILFFLNTCDFT